MKVSQGLKSFYSTSQLRRYLTQFGPFCCGEKANYKNDTSKRKIKQNDSFALHKMLPSTLLPFLSWHLISEEKIHGKTDKFQKTLIQNDSTCKHVL